MRRARQPEITIHLDDIRDLFVAPAADPFSTKFSFIAGIEIIKREVRSRLWMPVKRERTRIFLPKDRIEPGLAGKTRAAFQRYCQFQLQQSQQTLSRLRRSALRALLIGILFLLGGLYFSQLLGKLFVEPPFITTLFGDGFDIAFWVILWRPVDFFLFDFWPYWGEKRLYKQMMTMEIVVDGEP